MEDKFNALVVGLKKVERFGVGLCLSAVIFLY